MTSAVYRPNIILFVADDLGWADLSCYGAQGVSTPRIDALASRGTRFWDCHAASSVCTPSRYGILTGRYPWRSPLKAGVLGGGDPCIIRPGMLTMAGMLASAGYRTGAFGKWHLGLDWTRTDGTTASAFRERFEADMQGEGREIDYGRPFANGPLEHGFERFFGISGSLDMPPYCFLDQDRTVGIPMVEKDPRVTSQRPGLMVPEWRDDQVDVRVSEEAVAWLRAQDDKRPFFAYVASAAPHRPCVPPDFVIGTSRAGRRGDSIHLVDWMVGRLVDALDASTLQDTVFIITSDNGAPLIFPEDGDVVAYPPNGSWRGQKGDAYEGGHRVPLIWSGTDIPSEVVHFEPMTLLDLMPTLATLAGVCEPEDVDGVVIQFPEAVVDAPSPDRIFGVQAYDGRLTLRSGVHKAIYGSGSGGFSEPVGVPCGPESQAGQLYDLQVDPAETTNLWGSEAGALAAELHDRFSSSTGYAPSNWS